MATADGGSVWTAIQHYHRVSRQAAGASPADARAVLEQVPLEALLALREDTVLARGAPDQVAALRDVMRTLLATNDEVLRAAAGVAFQRRQMQSLSPDADPRLARDVLRDLRAIAESAAVPFASKLAFVLGHGGAFLMLVLQCVVGEDLDVYEAAAAAVRAVAACRPPVAATASDEVLFQGFVAAVLRTLGGSGLLRAPPAFGNAMLQLRCVGLACSVVAASPEMLARTRALPAGASDLPGYILLLLRVPDFLIQLSALELVGDIMLLPAGPQLLLGDSGDDPPAGQPETAQEHEQKQQEQEGTVGGGAAATPDAHRQLRAHIRTLATGFYAVRRSGDSGGDERSIDEDEDDDDDAAGQPEVHRTVRAAACRLFGFFVSADAGTLSSGSSSSPAAAAATAATTTAASSLPAFVDAVLGAGDRDANNPAAFDVSSTECNEMAVASMFGCVENFVQRHGSAALRLVSNGAAAAQPVTAAAGVAPGPLRSFVAAWGECVCGNFASTELQGLGIQALRSCVAAAVAEGTASAAQAAVTLLDDCFFPSSGEPLVTKLMRKLRAELDEAFRLAVLGFLRCACLLHAGPTSWGPRQIVASTAAVEYLIDPQSEDTKEGREAKFAVLDALMKHPAVGGAGSSSLLAGQPAFGRLRRVHAAGPYPRFPSEAAVATSSAQ